MNEWTSFGGTRFTTGLDFPDLKRLPLVMLRSGDHVLLPKRVTGILIYDPAPVTVTRILACGNGSLVICWDGGERLYAPEMQVGSPAIVMPEAQP